MLVPKEYKELAEKAYKTKSRKAKIRFFCLQCRGFSPSEVEMCPEKACVFYSVRRTG